MISPLARANLEILKNKFEMNLIEPPLPIKHTPDEAVLDKCFALGKRVAESLIPRA